MGWTLGVVVCTASGREARGEIWGNRPPISMPPSTARTVSDVMLAELCRIVETCRTETSNIEIGQDTRKENRQVKQVSA